MHREEGPVQEQEGLEKVQEDLREVLSCGRLARNLSARCAQLYSGRDNRDTSVTL